MCGAPATGAPVLLVASQRGSGAGACGLGAYQFPRTTAPRRPTARGADSGGAEDRCDGGEPEGALPLVAVDAWLTGGVDGCAGADADGCSADSGVGSTGGRCDSEDGITPRRPRLAEIVVEMESGATTDGAVPGAIGPRSGVPGTLPGTPGCRMLATAVASPAMAAKDSPGATPLVGAPEP